MYTTAEKNLVNESHNNGHGALQNAQQGQGPVPESLESKMWPKNEGGMGAGIDV